MKADKVALVTPHKTITRGNVFDFLRLFAAVSVVVAHGVKYLDQSFLWHGPDDPLWFPDGVSMFFIMSGMFVFRSAERTYGATGHWRDYFRNRYLRIAPALYVYTVIVLLIPSLLGAVPWQDIFTPGVALWFGLSFILLPGYDPAAFASFGTGIINGALWTIPTEVSFYLVVPILFLVARKIGINRVLVICLVVAVVSPILASTSGGAIENILHHTFFEYFICFILGVFWSKYWKMAPKHWALFVLSVAIYVVALRIPSREVTELLDPLLISVPLSYAVVWFGYCGPILLQKFTKIIGDISFGTYIWHWPIINIILWSGVNWGAWTVPALLAGALALGSASWWLVERHALSLKHVSARARAPRPDDRIVPSGVAGR